MMTRGYNETPSRKRQLQLYNFKWKINGIRNITNNMKYLRLPKNIPPFKLKVTQINPIVKSLTINH